MNIDTATIKNIGPNTKRVRPVDTSNPSQNNNTLSYKKNSQHKKHSKDKQFNAVNLVNASEEICSENDKQFASDVNIPCTMYTVELRNKIKPLVKSSLNALKINAYKNNFSEVKNSSIDTKG